VPIVAGLVMVLTWFLLQGTTPDDPRSRPEDALRAIAYYNAALQRDVLRARAGLLRSYDPLVHSTERLRAAQQELESAGAIAREDVKLEIDARVDALASAIATQEALVEAFKSDNALLRNSLAWLDTLSGRLSAAAHARTGLDSELGTLTAAMLRFAHAPSADTSRQVAASLDRQRGQPVEPPLAADVRSLVAHGRLVLGALPRVDELVSRLQAASPGVHARALQGTMAALRERAATRADRFLALLYVAALSLVAWATYLFLRLRGKATALQERLDLESLVAATSAKFINLPRDRIRAGIAESLGRLVEHAGLDRAQVVVLQRGEPDLERSVFFDAAGTEIAEADAAEVAELVTRFRPSGLEREGCIPVPEVRALPGGRERTLLEKRGVRSWLCIPLKVGGEHLGALALDAVREVQRWRDDDIALLRTAAETFASAIARENSEDARDELQARLHRSQRLEAIGTLAGGIAHEFNNILGAVRGYGEMALAALAEGSRPRRHVEQILKAGARAQDVVEQVLAFGRRRERQHRALDIEAVVAEAAGLVRASFPATVSIDARMAAAGTVVMGDRTELQQVVVNLCRNAAQAMDEDGVIMLGLDRMETRHATKLSHGTLAAGRWVRLLVRDAGHGIEPKALERLFEPFFTTRRAGQGHGARPVHGARDRRGPRRGHPRREPARPRRHVRGVLPVRGGGGRRGGRAGGATAALGAWRNGPHRRRRRAARAPRRGDAGRVRLRAGGVRPGRGRAGGGRSRAGALRPRDHGRDHARHAWHGARARHPRAAPGPAGRADDGLRQAARAGPPGGGRRARGAEEAPALARPGRLPGPPAFHRLSRPSPPASAVFHS
jgi:signal transduction histidine kinase